jgi:hypothetical protein
MEIECDRVEKLVQGGGPSDVCCFLKPINYTVDINISIHNKPN